MPIQVALHQLDELSHNESKNQILLDTNINTELNIEVVGEQTIISFPYGNKFDFIDGKIIIHEK